MLDSGDGFLVERRNSGGKHGHSDGYASDNSQERFVRNHMSTAMDSGPFFPNIAKLLE
jgi:hypothetical protein